MGNLDPLLSIKLEGSAIGKARIRISHLIRLIENLKKSLLRTGKIIQKQNDKIYGRKSKFIKEAIELDLVLLTHGSPATTLGFDRHGQIPIDKTDVGLEILEKSLKGLSAIQDAQVPLPPEFDSGVLMAWRDIGLLFEMGCNEITFTLNHRSLPVTSKYTPMGFQTIKKRIQEPRVNLRTIEGRLLMADFKEHGTRCRVHPSVGDPVSCIFDDEKKDEVLENILRYVRIIGEAKEDPISNRIISIVIHDIQQLEDKGEELEYLLPQGTPLPSDFWQSPTLEELAEAQGVRPVKNVSALFGTWPGEVDDNFEDNIHLLREQSIPRRG